LAIKCFSAHTYYINSKIISDININDAKPPDEAAPTVSQLLLELDFIKRELYSQINYGRSLEVDKGNLKNHIRKMEDEMQLTINTYQELIGS
jgi:hypothetical protein